MFSIVLYTFTSSSSPLSISCYFAYFSVFSFRIISCIISVIYFLVLPYMFSLPPYHMFHHISHVLLIVFLSCLVNVCLMLYSLTSFLKISAYLSSFIQKYVQGTKLFLLKQRQETTKQENLCWGYFSFFYYIVIQVHVWMFQYPYFLSTHSHFCIRTINTQL